MKARITIEYDENLKGEGCISVLTETDPPVDVSSVYWLGLLQLAQKYILLDWEDE